MSRAEEAAFLAPFIEGASQGQIEVAAEIRAAFEQRVGRRTAPSTIYLPAQAPRLAQAGARPGASAKQRASTKALEKKLAQEVG